MLTFRSIILFTVRMILHACEFFIDQLKRQLPLSSIYDMSLFTAAVFQGFDFGFCAIPPLSRLQRFIQLQRSHHQPF